MKRMLLALVSMFFFPASGFLQPAKEDQARIIFMHVNVLTMEDSSILEDQAVVIAKDRIISVIPARKVRRQKGDQVIEGRNGYLLPGLMESHCHMGSLNAGFLQDFLSYGITTIRIPSGNETNRAWRDLIRNQLLTGPELFVTAPLIDGNPPAWGSQHQGPVLTNPDSVDYFLDKLVKQDRYDGIKLYQRLDPAIYTKFLRACAEKKIRVASHIPLKMHRDSILSRETGVIEHLSGYPRLLYAPASFSPRMQKQVFEGNMDLLASADPDLSLLDSIAKKTAALGIWNCPTQVMYEMKSDSLAISRLKTEMHLAKYPALFSWWNSVHRTPDSAYLKLVELKRLIIRSLQQNGARLLAGTDSPNPWLLPGLSLHQELQCLVKAGLSPYQALLAATVNPAAYLGLEKTKGKILPGMNADLLLLEKNPLEDIRNTLRIRTVICNGNIVAGRKEGMEQQVINPD